MVYINIIIFLYNQLLYQGNMPFKVKLIKEFQKNLKASKDNVENQENIGSRMQSHASQKNKNKQKKRIINKNYNLYQLILRNEPISSKHVINFFNIIALNEEALRYPQWDQSYIKTLFYMKSIKKIQCKPTHLLLHLSDSPLNFPPLQYVVQRFRSFGDAKFYNLANLMTEAASKLNLLQKLELKNSPEENSDFLEKYTETMRNKMYFCRSSTNKMAISKSLLQYLEYQPEDFALQSIKFKSIIHQAFSAENYFDVKTKFFQNFRNLLDLINDRITLEAFLDNSIIRFKDYVYTKNNKKLYCKIKTGMPNPMINLYEVEEIIGRSQQFHPNPYHTSHKEKNVEEMRLKIMEKQIMTARTLVKLPKNIIPQNNHRVCRYISVENGRQSCAPSN